MKCLKTPVILATCFFLLTCGIDEYYYLPQLSEGRIKSEFNTYAEINIPSNFLGQAYYASGYTIFYRIYISNFESDYVVNDIINKNPSITNSNIYRDYYSLYPYTDPTNATSITSLTTFSSRGFYELELEDIDIRNTVLSKNGGTFIIQFPTRPGDKPYIKYNDIEHSLFRSDDKGVFSPKPNKFFFNSDDLKNYSYVTPTVNADVSGLQSEVGTQTRAYASMYVVAVGQNPRNFTRLYGKPTHINVFLLPAMN